MTMHYYHTDDLRAQRGLITLVLWKQEIERLGGESFVQLVVEQMLKGRGARGAGTVHSWRYSNGDTRYTFQPVRYLCGL